MFEVKGIPILYNEVTLLEDLRTQVELRTGKQILHKIRESGNNIMICCPIHSNGQEKNPSCGITTTHMKNTLPGTVHCFACGYIDTLEGMISKCFGHYEDNSYGINWLMENYIGDTSSYTRPDLFTDISREHITNKVEYITETELSKYRYYHPYMFQRKLTKEVIQKYDIGYQKDYIPQENWNPMEVITFPVRDINGNCLFVSRRSIYGKTFFLPHNLDKPLYGIYELPKNIEELVVCESVFNALTSVVYGRPAVALFGTGTAKQIQELNKLPVRKITLGLDPDNAGNKGTEKLKRGLHGKIITRLIIPQGKDINDLSLQEFKNLPEIFV